MQAQRQAAEETLRRAQEERSRIEQDRKLLESDKRTATATKQQAEAGQRAAAAVPAAAPTSVGEYDGTYSGRIGNQALNNVKPNCWPVTLMVRRGAAEGSWLSGTQNPSRANGTVAANGVFELKLAGWTRGGNPVAGLLIGRITDDAIAASGQWADGHPIAGDWKRAR